MTSLTVSIVTANNRKLICDCLESIYATLEGLSCEVFVVINASRDDSETVIRERFPMTNLIVNQERRGFTYNHNQVMRRAGGKYVLILNDDTLMRPGALRKMVDFMDRSPGTGLLGPRILNPDLSLQWSAGRGITHKYEYFTAAVLKNILPFLIRERHYHQTLEVSWLTGACLLARAEALEKVGLFDENIVIYFEDGDLCYRMIRAGWKVVFYPDAEIIHYLGQTRRQHLARDLEIIFQSGCYFFDKHYSFPSAMVIRGFMLLWAVSRYGVNLFHPARRDSERLGAYGRAIRLLLGSSEQRYRA